MSRTRKRKGNKRKKKYSLRGGKPKGERYDINTKKRAKDVLEAFKRLPEKIPGFEKIEEIPDKIIESGKNIVETVTDKVEEIPKKIKEKISGNKLIKKIEKIPHKIKEDIEHPCDAIEPIIDDKVDISGNIMDIIPQPKICGEKPTSIVKNVAKEIKGAGHVAVSSVKSMFHSILPTFRWPVDGHCAIQKGGRRTRRRRKRRSHKRYKKHKRTRKRTRKRYKKKPRRKRKRRKRRLK